MFVSNPRRIKGPGGCANKVKHMIKLGFLIAPCCVSLVDMGSLIGLMFTSASRDDIRLEDSGLENGTKSFGSCYKVGEFVTRQVMTPLIIVSTFTE